LCKVASLLNDTDRTFAVAWSTAMYRWNLLEFKPFRDRSSQTEARLFPVETTLAATAINALKRDGTYVCGCCSLEDDILVMHPYSLNHQRPEQLLNHHDAEVVGRIVVVVRGL